MASPVNDSYNVGSGVGIYAGRYNWPLWRRNMTANTWIEIPGNKLEDIDPAADPLINPNHPSNSPWHGNSGQPAMISAYNGACFDQKNAELWLITNGGHGDYAGNEIYKINLTDDSACDWELVRWPSGAVGNTITLDDGQEETGLYSDGRPRSCHTYNKPVFIDNVGPALVIQGGTYKAGGGAGTEKPVFIDPNTGEMSFFGSAAPVSDFNTSAGAGVYDPSRHCFWWRGKGTEKIHKYDIDTDTWSAVGSSKATGQNSALEYLPDEDCLLWIAGSGLSSGIGVFDCATETLYEPSLTGSFTGMTLSGKCRPHKIIGETSCAVWHNTSDTTTINTLNWSSNPRTDTWTVDQLTLDGSNAVTPSTCWSTQGTHGRFFYSSKLDGFGLINAVDEPIYFYARS